MNIMLEHYHDRNNEKLYMHNRITPKIKKVFN